MPLGKLNSSISRKLEELEEQCRAKGQERVIERVVRPREGKGFRYVLKGHQGEFIKMDSNSYLGFNHEPALEEAEAKASKAFGVGPGAVRFIDGTFEPHIQLEAALARFHEKEACILFSSAYAAVCGTLAPLITDKTIVVSDELNHNCIINALRLAKLPRDRKFIFRHLDYSHLKEGLDHCKKQNELGACERVIIVTDGVFSMRGDWAKLDTISLLAREYDVHFKEGVITIVDDSHGVAAFGKTGRGTPEVTNTSPDIIIATLGKGFGVNGGYAAASQLLVRFLREASMFYVYTNPITPGEAAAGLQSVSLIDSELGQGRKKTLEANTRFFIEGVKALGLEIIEGEHPIVPVLVRDTARTKELVKGLFGHGILAVGLGYPVVPKGQDTLRFQVSAVHTKKDLEYVLSVLKGLV
jgi:glycine C-acetyltransferase